MTPASRSTPNAVAVAELIEDLREQDVNANAMPKAMFEQLVANISRTGALESMPLVASRKGSARGMEVVSGHHRVRAARRAGLQAIPVLHLREVDDAELISKQLSHNAIAGESDPALVMELFQAIDDVDWQEAAFVAPAFEDIVADFAPPVVGVGATVLVTIAFLPEELEEFRQAAEKISTGVKAVFLAEGREYEAFAAAVSAVRTKLDVRAIPTAISEMARIVLEQVGGATA